MTTLTRSYVSAGTFHVSAARDLILQAYLGTCVGLALYCRNTGVGGIMHVLLPEPVSVQGAAEQPEKYATTGLPLFIEALLAAGAQENSLIATLAGGALVGPLSRQDLDLDIGGRTVEKVRALLAEKNIEIGHAETGGFFTCCLNLDLNKGNCFIEPAGYVKTEEPVQVRMPSAAEIKQAMDQLKPIPQVALKVLRMMEKQDCPVREIAEEVRKDQVITARLMMLANSAMFGPKRNIDSLDHAMVYLGQDLLVKLIISAAVHSYFNQTGMGYSLCKGGIYYHAIGCAQVAEALARNSGRADPGKAYTAGLLHDIGKVVLDQYVASVFPLFYRKVFEEGENTLDMERRFFGLDHTAVGYILAKQWEFPESLVEIIRYHHSPEKASEHRELAAIVHVADLLLSRFHVGLEVERMATAGLANHLSLLDMQDVDIPHLVDMIPASVFSNAAAASLFTPDSEGLVT